MATASGIARKWMTQNTLKLDAGPGMSFLSCSQANLKRPHARRWAILRIQRPIIFGVRCFTEGTWAINTQTRGADRHADSLDGRTGQSRPAMRRVGGWTRGIRSQAGTHSLLPLAVNVFVLFDLRHYVSKSLAAELSHL